MAQVYTAFVTDLSFTSGLIVAKASMTLFGIVSDNVANTAYYSSIFYGTIGSFLSSLEYNRY